MIQRLARLSPDQRRRVLELLGAEAERTGRQPLDEVNRLAVTELSELLDQREHWLSFADGGLVGYAVVTTDEVAELSAAILGAELGLPVAHLDHHASYIAHWLELLKSDDRAMLTAAAKAEVAASLILRLGGRSGAGSEAAAADLAEAA